jgi:hypothetical protein
MFLIPLPLPDFYYTTDFRNIDDYCCGEARTVFLMYPWCINLLVPGSLHCLARRHYLSTAIATVKVMIEL